ARRPSRSSWGLRTRSPTSFLGIVVVAALRIRIPASSGRAQASIPVIGGPTIDRARAPERPPDWFDGLHPAAHRRPANRPVARGPDPAPARGRADRGVQGTHGGTQAQGG